jgi:hypothetical protein
MPQAAIRIAPPLAADSARFREGARAAGADRSRLDTGSGPAAVSAPRRRRCAPPLGAQLMIAPADRCPRAPVGAAPGAGPTAFGVPDHAAAIAALRGSA